MMGRSGSRFEQLISIQCTAYAKCLAVALERKGATPP